MDQLFKPGDRVMYKKMLPFYTIIEKSERLPYTVFIAVNEYGEKREIYGLATDWIKLYNLEILF